MARRGRPFPTNLIQVDWRGFDVSIGSAKPVVAWAREVLAHHTNRDVAIVLARLAGAAVVEQDGLHSVFAAPERERRAAALVLMYAHLGHWDRMYSVAGALGELQHRRATRLEQKVWKSRSAHARAGRSKMGKVASRTREARAALPSIILKLREKASAQNVRLALEKRGIDISTSTVKGLLRDSRSK